MSTPEGKVKEYLVKRIRALGGDVRFARWIGRNDCPDCLVMLPKRGCWVETKAPGEKPRATQEREFAEMRRLGETVLILASIEEVDLAFPLF